MGSWGLEPGAHGVFLLNAAWMPQVWATSGTRHLEVIRGQSF